MAEENRPSEPLEIESINPDEISTDDLEDASGGTVTCSTYVSCSGYSSGTQPGTDPGVQKPGS